MRCGHISLWIIMVVQLAANVANAQPPSRRPPSKTLPDWAQTSWMARRNAVPEWALTSANVIDVTKGRVLKGVNVIVAGDMISRVTTEPVPPEMRTVDISGKYVIPGLFDLHAHIQTSPGASPDSEEGAIVLRQLLDHGVTTVRALPLLSEYATQVSALVATGRVAGPTIVPASGVFERTPQRTSWGFGDPETARAWVRREALNGTRWIKVYNSMDEASLTAIIEECDRYGMRVCGHTEDVPPALAVQLGIGTLEHVVSFPLSCLADGAERPKGLGLVERTISRWKQVDDERAEQLMRNMKHRNVGWVPTLVVLEQIAEQGGRERGLQLQEGDAAEMHNVIIQAAEKAVAFHRMGGLVGMGTDFPVDNVPIGESVHRELELLVNAGGATPAEALQIATIESAKILGFGEMLGTVSDGKQADLVVLERNPLEDISATRTIAFVVHSGRMHKPGGSDDPKRRP